MWKALTDKDTMVTIQIAPAVRVAIGRELGLQDGHQPLERAAALGAHAIVGVDMDYEVLGQGNMLMVTASGTAVTVEAA